MCLVGYRKNLGTLKISFSQNKFMLLLYSTQVSCSQGSSNNKSLSTVSQISSHSICPTCKVFFIQSYQERQSSYISYTLYISHQDTQKNLALLFALPQRFLTSLSSMWHIQLRANCLRCPNKMSMESTCLIRRQLQPLIHCLSLFLVHKLFLMRYKWILFSNYSLCL